MFYYGHPAVLYVNKMRVAGLWDAPVNAAFESLFETGAWVRRRGERGEGTNLCVWILVLAGVPSS